MFICFRLFDINSDCIFVYSIFCLIVCLFFWVVNYSCGQFVRDEDPDPVIFGPPDPVLFSTDPDSDPTCNNGFIKLFLS